MRGVRHWYPVLGRAASLKRVKRGDSWPVLGDGKQQASPGDGQQRISL